VIETNGLAELRTWLDGFWDDALKAFKVEVERKKARARRETSRARKAS